MLLLMDVLLPDNDLVLDLHDIFHRAVFFFFGPDKLFAEGLPLTVLNVSNDDLGVASLFFLTVLLGSMTVM